MDKAEKKRLKASLKAQKKQAKTQQKLIERQSGPSGESPKKIIIERPSQPSTAVRFAEAVRGIIFLIFAVSLVVAVILSQTGYIITTNEIINGLIAHLVGRIILIVVAVAFFIYGLKYLRAIK